MKIIVAHISPDWDAITSVWLLKKYLSGWQDADVQFVPAGQRLRNLELKTENLEQVVERIGNDEVIHVDTGLGPLDHHQTQNTDVSAASLTWDYVRAELKKAGDSLTDVHIEAVSRLVKIVVDTDHFKEVFWPDPASDIYEFTLLGVMEGLKNEKQNQDKFYLDFGIQCLNALLCAFENRIWAEKEINEKGIKFETRYGKGMGFETLNDTVLKLAQKMGYMIVVRKDPRKGYVRIKALPAAKGRDIDLTLVYEQLKKIDPVATWFLHVSKKMLLNGTPKNPKMVPTKLSLSDIIKVLEKI
jgi:hypothetical protein